MHHKDKYSQHSSIIWPVWLNDWVFVYELSACGFEPSCSQLIDYMYKNNKSSGSLWSSQEQKICPFED